LISIRISRRTLRALSWTALAASGLAGLYSIGAAATPGDSSGRPVILSPSLWAADRCRGRVQEWTNTLAHIDHGLTLLLSREAIPGATALYAQSEEMQMIGENTASLVQKVRVAALPVAMAGLQEQALEAAQGYLDTAVCAAHWIGVPSEETHRAALEALRVARALRLELEESRWLAID
jgi:hypothetical protein